MKVKNYSLGEKKDAFAAIAIVAYAARVVLLDEVLNGLDRKESRKVLLYCLVQLEKEATVILSGHVKNITWKWLMSY